jgi:hypothetical protein
MSTETRELVVSKLFFQDDTQKSDLLDPEITNTNLIAALDDLLTQGHHIEITAVKSDHRDDGCGSGLHESGCAVDCWPLNGPNPGQYLDAGTEAFIAFLRDVQAADYVYDVGLGGVAYTSVNMTAAGPTAFQDDSEDHVHIGVRE